MNTSIYVGYVDGDDARAAYLAYCEVRDHLARILRDHPDAQAQACLDRLCRGCGRDDALDNTGVCEQCREVQEIYDRKTGQAN